MKAAALAAALALVAGHALAGPSDPVPEKDEFATIELHSGLSIGLGMLRLGGDEDQALPLEGELIGRTNIATRLIVDQNSGATFGYRIEVVPLSPATTVLVDILPLDPSDERSLRRLKMCPTCPAPRLVAASTRYPPRQLVREGDTIVIDLLERPGEKIVDIVKFSSEEIVREDLEDLRRRVRQAARYVRKGDELAGRGFFDDAIAEYRKAVVQQRDAATYRRLGRCHHQLGRLQAAVAEYKRALRVHETDAETRRDLATAYLDQGVTAQAVKGYRSAYRSDPRILDAAGVKPKNVGLQYYAFAKVYMAEGKSDEALAALEQATRAGFADLDAMKSDPDFAPLRQHPRFVGLVARSARS